MAALLHSLARCNHCQANLLIQGTTHLHQTAYCWEGTGRGSHSHTRLQEWGGSHATYCGRAEDRRTDKRQRRRNQRQTAVIPQVPAALSPRVTGDGVCQATPAVKLFEVRYQALVSPHQLFDVTPQMPGTTNCDTARAARVPTCCRVRDSICDSLPSRSSILTFCVHAE